MIWEFVVTFQLGTKIWQNQFQVKFPFKFCKHLLFVSLISYFSKWIISQTFCPRFNEILANGISPQAIFYAVLVVTFIITYCPMGVVRHKLIIQPMQGIYWKQNIRLSYPIQHWKYYIKVSSKNLIRNSYKSC